MQRLFVPDPLFEGAILVLDEKKSHYLAHVLRMQVGGVLSVFNGKDGQWQAKLEQRLKKNIVLCVGPQERPQHLDANVIFCFAPLKHARLDYMIQKAVEMGALELIPIKTQYTQLQSFSLGRAQANSIEAVEQSGRVTLAEVLTLRSLEALLQSWDAKRPLIFCDEKAPQESPLAVLKTIKEELLGVLIGPEGGFSASERALLRSYSFVHAISLGQRILRADTAAVAALSLVQATRVQQARKGCV